MAIITSPVPDVGIPDVDLPTFLLEGAAALGDKPAFVDGPSGRAVTFGAIGPMAQRFAAGLAARGFGPGDVLAILMPNLPEWPVAMLGAQIAGGAVTPINPLWTAAEIAHQVRAAGAVAILTVGAFLDTAVAVAGDAIVIVLGAGSPPAGVVPFGALMAADGPVPDVIVDPATTVAMLPYSSGTSGLPKGVRLTHRNIVANLCQIWPVLAPRADDVMLGVLPFFHAAGFCSSICLTMRAGATVVTQPRFDLEQCLKLVETHRATILPAAPPIVLGLARHPAVDRYDLSSLHFVICGSAPLSAELEAECATRLGRPVVQVYGLTETSPVVSISRRDGHRSAGAVGTLVANTEIRLVDPGTGAEVAAGETGELWVRGPQVMAGYLADPGATAATIDADGWLRTGDLGTVTSDGEVFVVDRVKELIKVAGFQVPPAELEALLGRHPAIEDVAVVGRPDPDKGERPIAFVVPRGALDPEAVIAWAAERTAGYKRLADIVVVSSIPRSPAGKILRRVLREGITAPA